jgi:hypothetical protein
VKAVNGDGLSKEHLIRQIAKRLSPELRAEYYRVLRYCRSLPEDDQMLLILNAIHLLPSMTIDVPGQMAEQRKKMEDLLRPTIQAQERTLDSFEEYQAHLDLRLARLPDEIAERIKPDVIAAKITEALRQQFADTTIPESTNLLKTGVRDLQTAVTDFKGAASSITDDCHGAVAESRRATKQLVSEATGLSGFHWYWAYSLAGLALIIGMILGALLCWWFLAPVQPSMQTAARQQPTNQQATPTVNSQKARQNLRR